MTESARRYTEREMAVILRLATEIEARATLPAVRGDAVRGRTLREIEEVAASAGIAGAAIRAAAAALESDDQGLFDRVLGGPTLFRIERFVTGELPDRELVDLIGSARWALGKEGGETIDVPDGVGWQYTTSEGPLTQIELSRRTGQTRLRLLAKYEDPAAWTLLGGLSATIAGSAFGILFWEPSFIAGAGMVTGLAAASWLGARRLWRFTARRVRRRLLALMDRLEDQARQFASESTEPTGSEEATIQPLELSAPRDRHLES